MNCENDQPMPSGRVTHDGRAIRETMADGTPCRYSEPTNCICNNCGSEETERLVWVTAYSGEITDNADEHQEDERCAHCGACVILEPLHEDADEWDEARERFLCPVEETPSAALLAAAQAVIDSADTTGCDGCAVIDGEALALLEQCLVAADEGAS
jgi:hypothetical protein